MTKLESAKAIIKSGGNCNLPIYVSCDDCPFEDGTIDCSDVEMKYDRAEIYIAEHKKPVKILTILQAVSFLAESLKDGTITNGPEITERTNEIIVRSGGEPHMDGTILRKARMTGMYYSLKGDRKLNPEKKKSQYCIDHSATKREFRK